MVQKLHGESTVLNNISFSGTGPLQYSASSAVDCPVTDITASALNGVLCPMDLKYQLLQFKMEVVQIQQLILKLNIKLIVAPGQLKPTHSDGGNIDLASGASAVQP